MFGLEALTKPRNSVPNALPGFLAEPQIKLATARGAFNLLCSFLAPKTVWLPSYLCGVIIDAVASTRIPVRFYTVDGHLKVAEDEWLNEIIPGDIAVFIDYFGFNAWSESGAEARKRGAWVVEDACQAMLNERFCEYSHYIIFSPRKFIGVPDGGILMAQDGSELPSLNLQPPRAEWWLDAFTASRLRAEFDQYGGDRRWFDLFRKTDPSGPLEPTQMSEISSLLLIHAIDYKAIAARRQENYRLLAREIPDLALLPELPLGITPLGFPIRLPDRDQVQKSCFAKEIYPTVHWPITGVVPPQFLASHYLAREIMTLPCDQRYGPTDLTRMIALLREKGA